MSINNMRYFYSFLPKINSRFFQIEFFGKNNQNISDALKNKDLDVFKISIPDKYFTNDINEKKRNKILRIDKTNWEWFTKYNFLHEYNDEIQYTIMPYRLAYPCHPEIYKNFIGIDATLYKSLYTHEYYDLSGKIWNTKKIDFDMKLI